MAASAAPPQQSLQAFWQQLLDRVPGLRIALVTDQDGVSVLSAESQPHETLTAPSFLTTATACMDQASKLGMGKNQCVAARYQHVQIVQFSLAPLVVHLIATPEANTGLMMDLGAELRAALQPLQASFGQQ